MRTLYIFYFIVASIYAKSCEHEWRSYHGTNEPLVYGVFVGNFNTGIPAFVGRALYDDMIITGRIQTSDPAGLYHVSAWSVHHIVNGVEYLVKNPNHEYKWIASTDGQYVEDAVSPGYTPGRGVSFVGRTKIDGRTYYGKVIPTAGMHYEDGNKREVATKKYEILTCTA
ncbi:uncharacterized protein [Chironomus tepperi]|uniref:uncharacterized protein n=1 Tax=Chironomus tepperi TaxID=113505 RepID=UPI00391FB3AC